MDSLSMADVRRLMAAIERINSAARMEAFSGEVFQAINELMLNVTSYAPARRVSCTAFFSP
jgi:hypothetical protein